MPATFLSHQAPAVALKLWRPRWFDGVALVVGSMSPDFAYVATDTRLEFDAHGPAGMLAFAVPASAALAWLLRARVAAVFFALAPPLGALRLNDWRVLAARRPPWGSTLASALVGALTHSLWDTFTHEKRLGARIFPALRETLFSLGPLPVSLARTFQYVGHVFGALATIALLRYIARAGLLARWYGPELAALPPPHAPAGHRLRLALVFAVTFAAGLAWGLGGNVSSVVLRVASVMFAGLTAFCLVVGNHPAYRVAGPADALRVQPAPPP
ncbi:MAG: DUF4184 family protein [Polyangiales bacterium]